MHGFTLMLKHTKLVFLLIVLTLHLLGCSYDGSNFVRNSNLSSGSGPKTAAELKKYQDPEELYRALRDLAHGKIKGNITIADLLAYQGGSPKQILDRPMSNDKNLSLVHKAAEEGDVKLLNALLDAAPDYDVNAAIEVNQFELSQSPLQHAVNKGFLTVVELLLKHGAHPSKGSYYKIGQRWYYSALATSAKIDNEAGTPIFRALLKNFAQGLNSEYERDKAREEIISILSNKDICDAKRAQEKLEHVLDSGFFKASTENKTLDNLYNIILDCKKNQDIFSTVAKAAIKYANEGIGKTKVRQHFKCQKEFHAYLSTAFIQEIEEKEKNRRSKIASPSFSTLDNHPNDNSVLLNDIQIKDVDDAITSYEKGKELPPEWQNAKIKKFPSKKRVYGIFDGPNGIGNVVIKIGPACIIENYEPAKNIILNNHLDRLVLPRTVAFDNKWLNKRFLIEEMLDIGTGGHREQQIAYEKYYEKIDGGNEDLKNEFGELFRQLAIFVEKSGFYNLNYGDLPLMNDGTIRIALVDLDFGRIIRESLKKILIPEDFESVVHPIYFDEINYKYELDEEIDRLNIQEAKRFKEHERAYFKWLKANDKIDDKKVEFRLPSILDENPFDKSDIEELNKLYEKGIIFDYAVTLSRRRNIEKKNISSYVLEALKNEGQIFDFGSGKTKGLTFNIYP